MRSPTVCFVALVVFVTLLNVPLHVVGAPVADVSSSINFADSSTKTGVQSPSEAFKQQLPSVKSPSSSTNDAVTNGTQRQLPVAESAQQVMTVTPSAPSAVAAIKPTEIAKTSDDLAIPSDTLTDDVNEPMVYDDVSRLMAANQNEVNAYDDAEDEALLEQLLRPRETRRSSDDIDVSPRAMAQYLLLTSDFRGVQQAVDEFVSNGLLTADEADRFEDAVAVEYTSMSQLENYLPLRDQRSILQHSDKVRDPTLDQVDYGEYLSPSNVVVATGDDDEEQLQRQGYLPIDPDTMAQIDDRILQELLQQQAQPSDNGDYDDERHLEEAENNTPEQASSTATETDSEPVLEAELESLSESQKHGVEHDDSAEEELEQIGKLMRTASKEGQSTASKKP